MAENIAEVNDSEREYPTDVVGECAIARIFVAQKFIECGLIDEAKFCLGQVTNTFPLPRTQFLHAAFKSATSKAREFRSKPSEESEFHIELYQGGKP